MCFVLKHTMNIEIFFNFVNFVMYNECILRKLPKLVTTRIELSNVLFLMNTVTVFNFGHRNKGEITKKRINFYTKDIAQ